MDVRNLLLIVLSIMSVGKIEAKKMISPKDWLLKNATYEQKRFIAKLQLENAIAQFKGSTFRFVGYETPHFKMFASFPPYVQDYLAQRLSGICFEGRFCTKAGMTIKLHEFRDKNPTAEDIENFISDTYDFLKW